MSAEPVEWWVSVRSPYSWLALVAAQDELAPLWRRSQVRVFFEPGAPSAAELSARRLEFPYVPMSRAKHMYILHDVRREAGRRGLVPRWPVDRDPVWEVPSLALQEVLLQDDEQGRLLALDLARARFERGQDVLDPRVVVRCLRAVGADPALALAVEDQPARRRGGDALELVVRAGVFGVPFVRVGRQPFWGIDRLGQAQRAALREPGSVDPEGAGARRATPGSRQGVSEAGVAVGGRDLGDDHAGGCG